MRNAGRAGRGGTCERLHAAHSVVPRFRVLARPFERGMPEGWEEVESARGAQSAPSVVPLFRVLARPFERGMLEGREEMEPARGSTPLSPSFRASGFSLGRLNAECRKGGKRWNLRGARSPRT